MLASKHEENLRKLFLRASDLPFSDLRKRAWEKACQIGLPDRKSESFRKISLGPLYANEISGEKGKEFDVTPYLRKGFSHIVFIDGEYRPEFGDKEGLKGAVFKTLSDSLPDYGLFLQSRMNQNIDKSTNVFSLFAEALHDGGIFLYIPAKKQIVQPVQVLYFYTKESGYIAPKMQISVGQGASIKILNEEISLFSAKSSVNKITDVALDRGASCHMVEQSLGSTLSASMHHMRATVKRDARLTVIGVTTGSPLFRQDYSVELAEEGSHVDLTGAWSLRGSNRCYTEVRIEHKAESTTSNQFFKGLLRGKSRSTFEGKIYVAPIAQKTKAYQLNNNLLLDEGASAFCKPNLEIFADDVKASHGATIAKLNEEELFYLRSRGFSERMAKESLSRGFLSPITREIPYLDVQREVDGI